MNDVDKTFRTRLFTLILALPLGILTLSTSGCAQKNVPAPNPDSEVQESAPEVNSEETSNEKNDAFLQTEPGARAVVNYNGVKFAFRYCPAGSFTMGSPAEEEGREKDEEQREVTIAEGFWIGETETTQEQWNAVGVKAGREPAHKGAKLPVESVDWNECNDFVKNLNELGLAPAGWSFSLPSEEQWEYACRAGTTGADYGVALKDCALNMEFIELTPEYAGSGEVGQRVPNNWGLYDMLGNVWEWTNSKFDAGESQVIRGGCLTDDVILCRPAARWLHFPTEPEYNLGVRVVLIPDQTK